MNDDDFLDCLLDSIIAKGPKAPKKRRGMNGRSLGMLERAIPMIKAAQPITGRGVGYKLFVAKLIPNMSAMNRFTVCLKKHASWISSHGGGSLMKRGSLNARQAGMTQGTSRMTQHGGTVSTSGNSNHCVARCGRRRARSEACCSQCSTSTALAFESCTASPAQPSSIVLLLLIPVR
jgi:hypothetical protein